MGLDDYRRRYEKSFEEYRRNIEKLVDGLMPKIKWPLSIAGFLMTVAGVTAVFVISLNASVAGTLATAQNLVTIFLCTIISFFGYIIIHRSTENDWL